MPEHRQYPRITGTSDLRARLPQASGKPDLVRVLDLSFGGMLVEGSALTVGEHTAFELHGPDFRYAGSAEVAHITGQSTGLRFLCWQGQAHRPVLGLVDCRLASRPLRPLSTKRGATTPSLATPVSSPEVRFGREHPEPSETLRYATP